MLRAEVRNVLLRAGLIEPGKEPTDEQYAFAQGVLKQFEYSIRNHLTLLQLGKCTCLTKTPELKHHDPRCTYRLAKEIENELTITDP